MRKKGFSELGMNSEFIDKIEDHADEVDEEGDEEENDLADGDVLHHGVVLEHLCGVDLVDLLVEGVGVPGDERQVDEELQPEAAEQEERDRRAEHVVLGHHERVQILREIRGVEVDFEIRIGDELRRRA